jgi:ribosomal protein S27AE
MSNPFPPPGYIPTESALSGIDVFMPAPPDSRPQAEIVDFKCPQCGATTAFSVADGGLTCTHCGYYEAPKAAQVGRGAAQFEFTVETMQRAAQGWGVERKEIACQNCGATTSLPLESLTYTCAFCGSNKVIQRQAAQDALRPRYIIPFKVKAEACAQIARGWLGSSWMTPANLREISQLGKFTGVYLPYWTLDSTTHANWKAEVGHTKTERYYDNGEWKTRTVVEWRWESGHVDLAIDDLPVSGTARLSSLLLSKVQGFNLGELVDYDPNFLAGLQAQAYDVTLEKAWETGRGQMREQTRQACLAQASTSQVRNFSMSLDFADESWRYILAPVYISNYTYGGKTFQAMVNGQTGAIAGQRPVDWNKVWLAIAALLTPGVLFSLIGLITIPLAGIGVGLGAFGFVLLVIGVIVAIIIYTQANQLDDV